MDNSNGTLPNGNGKKRNSSSTPKNLRKRRQRKNNLMSIESTILSRSCQFVILQQSLTLSKHDTPCLPYVLVPCILAPTCSGVSRCNDSESVGLMRSSNHFVLIKSHKLISGLIWFTLFGSWKSRKKKKRGGELNFSFSQSHLVWINTKKGSIAVFRCRQHCEGPGPLKTGIPTVLSAFFLRMVEIWFKRVSGEFSLSTYLEPFHHSWSRK